MARAASTAGASGAPFAKLMRLGDKIEGAFGGSATRQQVNFDTKAPLYKDDGKPRLEEVMHFVAMPGTKAWTGDRDDPQPIDEGDHVRFSVKGHTWGQVIDGRKALPPYGGFRSGEMCSGDVYTIELIGWSVKSETPAFAKANGLTVVDGRIVMRTTDEKNRYVLARSERGENTNVGNDIHITIRRPNPDEKRWEQLADELYDSKVWAKTATAAADAHSSAELGDEEPF